MHLYASMIYLDHILLCYSYYTTRCIMGTPLFFWWKHGDPSDRLHEFGVLPLVVSIEWQPTRNFGPHASTPGRRKRWTHQANVKLKNMTNIAVILCHVMSCYVILGHFRSFVSFCQSTLFDT